VHTMSSSKVAEGLARLGEYRRRSVGFEHANHSLDGSCRNQRIGVGRCKGVSVARSLDGTFDILAMATARTEDAQVADGHAALLLHALVVYVVVHGGHEGLGGAGLDRE